MRAIVVTCPQCGANLRVDGDEPSVRCQYCGTESRIQQRSRVFQVPRPVGHTPQVPVARQQVSKAAFVVPLVVMVAAVGGGVVFAMRMQGVAQRAVDHATGTSEERMDWVGTAPVLGDVDGDGTDDLIGFVRYVLDGDRANLAAFSGTTGVRLWQSGTLGNSSTVSQAMLAAAGDAVYYTTDDGVLHARDRKTGVVRWNTPLGEKSECICAGTAAGEIVVQTADNKWWIVDGDGAQRPTTALLRLERPGSKPDSTLKTFTSVGPEGLPGLCLNLDNRAWQRPVQLLTIDSWSTLPTIDGMHVERLVRRPGGPVVAVGYKQPGTSVPMLARVDGKKVRWTSEIPSTDPLTSASEDNLAAMTDRAIFVAYAPRSSSGPTLLAAFDLADGHRLWEQALRHGPGSLTLAGIVVTGDVVVAASWGALQAFDQRDGTPRFMVGTL